MCGNATPRHYQSQPQTKVDRVRQRGTRFGSEPSSFKVPDSGFRVQGLKLEFKVRSSRFEGRPSTTQRLTKAARLALHAAIIRPPFGIPVRIVITGITARHSVRSGNLFSGLFKLSKGFHLSSKPSIFRSRVTNHNQGRIWQTKCSAS